MKTALAVALAFAFACATVGKNFDATQLSWLEAGVTTKAQVLEKLDPDAKPGATSAASAPPK